MSTTLDKNEPKITTAFIDMWNAMSPEERDQFKRNMEKTIQRVMAILPQQNVSKK
jgi:hypothetical protein